MLLPLPKTQPSFPASPSPPFPTDLIFFTPLPSMLRSLPGESPFPILLVGSALLPFPFPFSPHLFVRIYSKYSRGLGLYLPPIRVHVCGPTYFLILYMLSVCVCVLFLFLKHTFPSLFLFSLFFFFFTFPVYISFLYHPVLLSSFSPLYFVFLSVSHFSLLVR